MNQFIAMFEGIGRRPYPAAAILLAGLAFAGVGTEANAQGLRFVSPAPSAQVVLIEAEAANADTVQLILGISKIRADLQLGMLFLQDGLTHPEGSHFARPRATVWPEIRDGLAAAGIADIEPLLLTLEQSTTADAATAAFRDAEAALLKAQSALKPAPKTLAVAVIETVKAAAAEINPAGPTEVGAYQRAWSLLMVARGQLDLLARSEDAAIAKLATDEAIMLDDVILSMPDPNQTAPVAYDPAGLTDLIDRIQKMDEAV